MDKNRIHQGFFQLNVIGDCLKGGEEYFEKEGLQKRVLQPIDDSKEIGQAVRNIDLMKKGLRGQL